MISFNPREVFEKKTGLEVTRWAYVEYLEQQNKEMLEAIKNIHLLNLEGGKEDNITKICVDTVNSITGKKIEEGE